MLSLLKEVITISKANSICKNQNCNKGNNGDRKHFFACLYCLKSQNWRSICCSKECYDEYIEQVKLARSKNKSINLYPERTDMTQEEVVEVLLNKPFKEVVEKTKQELSGYEDDLEILGFNGVVDKINSKLNEEHSIVEDNSNKALQPISQKDPLRSKRNKK